MVIKNIIKNYKFDLIFLLIEKDIQKSLTQSKLKIKSKKNNYLLTLTIFNSEYKKNIILVDKIVAEVSDIISNYYAHDNKTTFIFTSDQ